MSAVVVLAVGLVGGVGAVARGLLGGAVEQRLGAGFPYGTLAVNLSGAFALGVLAGLAPSADAERILATGLLGAFTTFSTWMWESHRLAREGHPRRAAANLLVSLVLGVAAVWAGRRLGVAL